MTFNQHSAYISLPAVTTHANEPQDLRGSAYWTNVRQILAVGIFFIDGVNATVCVAIRPAVVEREERHLDI